MFTVWVAEALLKVPIYCNAYFYHTVVLDTMQVPHTSLIFLSALLLFSVIAIWDASYSIYFQQDQNILLQGKNTEAAAVQDVCQGQQILDFEFSKSSNWTIVLSANYPFFDFFENWW